MQLDMNITLVEKKKKKYDQSPQDRNDQFPHAGECTQEDIRAPIDLFLVPQDDDLLTK